MSQVITRPIDLLLVGNSRVESIENGLCTGCNNTVDKEAFSDVERKEYAISGWCKSCQDGFFRSPKQEPRPSAAAKSPPKKAHKIYIQVSYSQKENAKKLKARWNPHQKCWFTWSNNPNNKTLFAQYNRRDTEPAPETKIAEPTPQEPIYVPEGCILWGGRIRKQRFFDLNGDEI